jgi:hypothetical protein
LLTSFYISRVYQFLYSASDILVAFYDVRIRYYDKRKEYMLDLLTGEWEKLDNKVCRCIGSQFVSLTIAIVVVRCALS